MIKKIFLKATAAILALALIGSALPAAPLADRLKIFSSVAVNAEKNYKVEYNPTTKEARLSGVLPPTWKFSDLSQYKDEVVKISCQPGTVFNEDSGCMFQLFTALETVDLTGADFSKLKDGNSLFLGCFKLKSINLSNTDFSSATDLRSMFKSCTNLKDVIGLKSSSKSLTGISQMFMNCYSLASVDVSGINTSNVTDFRLLFYQCYNLISVDLSGFDTRNARTFDWMFIHCYSLRTLDLSSFDTSQAQSMKYMFGYCYSLISLDLSSFHTQNVKDMSNMFICCNSIEKLDLSNFDTSSCTNYLCMFSRCVGLRDLDISGFNISDDANTDCMVSNTNSLHKLKLGTGVKTVSFYYDYSMLNEWANEKDLNTIVSTKNEDEYTVISNDGENTYIKNPCKGNINAAGVNINKDGTLSMRIGVTLPDQLTEEEKTFATIRFVSEKNRSFEVFPLQEEEVPIQKDESGDYYTVFHVPAKAMANGYLIFLKINNENVDACYYSIRKYANYILADPDKYPNEQGLVKTMLLYGGAVKRYFAPNISDDPYVDSGINYSKTVVNDAHYFEKPSDISGLSYYGSSIILGSGVVQRHYFKLSNGSIGIYTFTVDGQNVAPKQYKKTDLYYVDATENAPIMKLYNPSSISVIKKSEPAKKMEFKYSVMDYVRIAKSDKTLIDSAIDIVRKLSWMADEAKSYFENK